MNKFGVFSIIEVVELTHFLTMSSSAPIRRFVLVYVALFINLAPSLHHAPIFGLHQHSAGELCCCGRIHHSKSLESPKSLEVEKAGCDCSLCRFFKYNQADLNPDVSLTRVESFCAIVSSISLHEFTFSFATKARGPPSLI